MGIANVIPGVSGGTMAVVFGIYERLIGIITFNVKKILSEWRFWLPLGVGMALGVVVFSKIVDFLYTQYPLFTRFFFAGIVAGSIPLIFKRCYASQIDKIDGNGTNADAKNAQNFKGPSISVWICCLVAFVFMIILSFASAPSADDANVAINLTPLLCAKLVGGGALAACAMIIPGISGSFLLLVLGIYSTVIAAVADLNIALLVPVAIGVVIGLFGGALLVRILMQKVPFCTYGVILGLVVGSIFAVLPFADCFVLVGTKGVLITFALALLCFACGFAIAFFQKETLGTKSSK